MSNKNSSLELKIIFHEIDVALDECNFDKALRLCDEALEISEDLEDDEATEVNSDLIIAQ